MTTEHNNLGAKTSTSKALRWNDNASCGSYKETSLILIFDTFPAVYRFAYTSFTRTRQTAKKCTVTVPDQFCPRKLVL